MPDAPSEEASAHYILATLLGYHWVGKKVLSIHHFAIPLAKRGWKDNDFNRGIRYATERGWVTTRIPTSFSLTDAGFAEARAITVERPRRAAAG